jgi:lysophospholipase L1-like esterase
MRRLLLALVLLVLAPAAPAGATVLLSADAASVRGYVQVTVVASADVKTVLLGERVGTVNEDIAVVDLPFWKVHPDLGPINGRLVERLVRWRCDRLDRNLQAAGRRSDGTYEGAFFSVRTPSCRNRMTLSVPRRVEAGGRIVATVRDTWGTGLTWAQVCLRGRCRAVEFGDGQAVRRVRLRAGRRGVGRVVLRATSQRESALVGIGRAAPAAASDGPTVLTTGDSLMQSVDSILQDRLAGRASVVSDVRLGGAISGVPLAESVAFARRQVRRHRPHATVLSLGSNEFYDMTTPDGRRVACCDEPWTAEYARRARAVMRAYAQSATASVVWLAVPAARDERRVPGNIAVNAALQRAAAGLPTVAVEPLDAVFTPGMRYADTLLRDGLTITVRQSDGIHLSIAGARIAADLVLDRLRAAGVL